MSYIAYSDFTDLLITQIGETTMGTYITLADNHLEDIAEQLGVETTDIETDPVHNTIKEYLKAYAAMRAFEDRIGANNVTMAESDKYLVKRNLMRQRVNEMRPTITYEMLVGSVNDVGDRVADEETLFRG